MWRQCQTTEFFSLVICRRQAVHSKANLMRNRLREKFGLGALLSGMALAGIEGNGLPPQKSSDAAFCATTASQQLCNCQLQCFIFHDISESQ